MSPSGLVTITGATILFWYSLTTHILSSIITCMNIKDLLVNSAVRAWLQSSPMGSWVPQETLPFLWFTHCYITMNDEGCLHQVMMPPGWQALLRSQKSHYHKSFFIYNAFFHFAPWVYWEFELKNLYIRIHSVCGLSILPLISKGMDTVVHFMEIKWEI